MTVTSMGGVNPNGGHHPKWQADPTVGLSSYLEPLRGALGGWEEKLPFQQKMEDSDLRCTPLMLKITHLLPENPLCNQKSRIFSWKMPHLSRKAHIFSLKIPHLYC